VNRSDLLAIIFVASAFVLYYLFSFTVSQIPPFSPVYTAIFGIPIYAYVSYWAFNIRSRLAVNAYRFQALGVALIALIFILDGLGNAFLPSYQGGSDASFDYIQALLYGTMLYWIDASVRVQRRLDPLRRDVLRWRGVRIGLWGYYFFVLFVDILLTLYDTFVLGQNPDTPSGFSGPTGLSIILMVAATGAIYLPTIAKRSKDTLLRQHVKWFGFFMIATLFFYIVIALFFILFFSGINPSFLFLPNGAFTFPIITFFGGYFLYRSARSLVPLNRLSLESDSK
jgi:hypothetical protein